MMMMEHPQFFHFFYLYDYRGAKEKARENPLQSRGNEIINNLKEKKNPQSIFFFCKDNKVEKDTKTNQI